MQQLNRLCAMNVVESVSMKSSRPANGGLAFFAATPFSGMSATRQPQVRRVCKNGRETFARQQPSMVSSASRNSEHAGPDAWITQAIETHIGDIPPHAGSHRVGTGNFFEGIYTRVQLPGTSFAIITTTERFSGSDPRDGRGSIQVIGPDDETETQFIDDRGDLFFSDPNVLCVGHWDQLAPGLDKARSARLLHPQTFHQRVSSGYQISAGWHQGATRDSARWDIQTTPLCSWGDRGRQSRPTTTVLSHLPIFDPGYQVLMAHGVANGSIQWKGRTYDLINAPCYSEKNWGRSFPSKWFWVQCNRFPDYPDLSVTAVGSTRKVFGREEKVGAIFIHLNGKLISLDSWTCNSHSWEVEPWGSWKVEGCSDGYLGSIQAWTDKQGTVVMGPTPNGLERNVRDSGQGSIRLQIMSADGTLDVDTQSSQAAVEVGGGPWEKVWQVQSRQAPASVLRVLSFLEGERPPGTAEP